jgi:hypothetical protein
MGAAGAASGMSLAAVGLQAYGSYEAGAGTKAGDVYKAQQLEQAAQYGELKATQVGGQLTRNLNITLGNIDAVRAAAHTDPGSPTGAAVRDYTEQVSTEQRGIEVANIEQQARQSEADAAYMRYAGSQALLAGDIGAASAVLGSFGAPSKGGTNAGGTASADTASGGPGYNLLQALSSPV